MKIKIIIFVIFAILSVVLSSQSLRKRETETETETEAETETENLKPGEYNGGGGIARPLTPNTEVPTLTAANRKVAGINVIKRKERINQGGGIGLRTNDKNKQIKNKYRNLNRRERKSRKADIGVNAGGGIMKNILKGTQSPMSHTSYMVSEHNMYRRRLRKEDKNKKKAKTVSKKAKEVRNTVENTHNDQ